MQTDIIQTLKTIYEAFRTRDVPTLFNLLPPDFEIIQSEEVPWGGHYHGHQQAFQYFGKLGTLVNSSVTVDRFIQSGDHILAIGWTNGSVNATGYNYRVPFVHDWKLEGTKIRHVQFFIDHPTMLDALNQPG